MTARLITCDTCKQESFTYKCDGCGIDVRNLDDAVRVDVTLHGSSANRAQLDYCRPCAVKTLPAAVGVGPGSDLPASLDPPEQP